MKRKTSNSTSARADSGVHSCWLAAAVLGTLVGVVYLPAANVPLIFDDVVSITGNDSIKSLWPLVSASKPAPLNPPAEHPTSARPLVNLSFAVNYSIGGVSPFGYHIVNIAIHFFNAMLLWVIVGRTLRLPYFAERFAYSADWLALAVAILWALHPLQTEAVIYATQRTELMMSFFYLATLYCSLGYWELLPSAVAVDDNHPQADFSTRRARRGWLCLSVVACLCGMASKEVMASAPLIVLLFERTFVSGTVQNCLRRSWPLYVGLVLTLPLLVGLTISGPRVDSAGFHLGIPAHVWWFTQSQITLLYLKLAIWPAPLLIHYELPYVTSIATAWSYVVPLLLAGVCTAILLWKNRPLGFLGTWFFAVLSPTFVIPVVTEMAAERRMYLALVPLCVVLVLGVYGLARKVVRRPQPARQPLWHTPAARVTGAMVVLLTAVFCFATSSRLAAYENELTLWMEVMQEQPENHRAHFYVATFLESQGKNDEAIEEYHEAIRLDPNPVQAHYRLGELLQRTGDYNEAAKHFGEAARGMPVKNANFYNSEAVALYMAGRNDEAIAAYRRVLDVDPTFWAAYKNMGTALQKGGKFEEAVQSFESALRLNPRAVEAYKDLANSHFRLNQKPQAIAALERGLESAKAAGDSENIKRFTAALQDKR